MDQITHVVPQAPDESHYLHGDTELSHNPPLKLVLEDILESKQ